MPRRSEAEPRYLYAMQNYQITFSANWISRPGVET